VDGILAALHDTVSWLPHILSSKRIASSCLSFSDALKDSVGRGASVCCDLLNRYDGAIVTVHTFRRVAIQVAAECARCETEGGRQKAGAAGMGKARTTMGMRTAGVTGSAEMSQDQDQDQAVTRRTQSDGPLRI